MRAHAYVVAAIAFTTCIAGTSAMAGPRIDALTFATLAATCAPRVDRLTLEALVRTESAYNPYAIGVVGGRLVRQPATLEEAVATAHSLERQGYNFSVGSGRSTAITSRALAKPSRRLSMPVATCARAAPSSQSALRARCHATAISSRRCAPPCRATTAAISRPVSATAMCRKSSPTRVTFQPSCPMQAKRASSRSPWSRLAAVRRPQDHHAPHPHLHRHQHNNSPECYPATRAPDRTAGK